MINLDRRQVIIKHVSGKVVTLPKHMFDDRRADFPDPPWRLVSYPPSCEARPASPAVSFSYRRKPLIVHYMPWQLSTGGAQRFISDLARFQVSFADVHLFHAKNGSDDLFRDALSGVTFHPFDQILPALEEMAAMKPDIIHDHHPQTRNAFKIAERVGCPYIGTPHNWAGNMSLSQGSIPICGPYADKISHGVDLDRFKPIAKSQKLKAKGSFTVGIIGRRSPEKIPHSFVEALKRFDNEAIRFRFIGHGFLYSGTIALTKALSELPNVETTDDVKPGDMPDAYRALDCVLIPSEHDSVSYVALEAMACGVPVIARGVEGLPDTIGDSGILCESDEALLSAVEMLFRNKKTRELMGKKGRARVELNNDLSKVLDRYDSIYKERTAGLIRKPRADVSVVIPVYNTPSTWLKACVDSVIDQIDGDEIVIVDDGSTNNDTLECLREISGHSSVRLVRIEHSGVGLALNAGIKSARSDIIIRIDADDIMKPGRIAAQVAYMKTHDVDVLAGQIEVMDADGNSRKSPVLSYDPAKRMWEQPWCIAHPAVCMRRNAVLSVGGYRDKPAQDFDLWCRLDASGAKFAVTPEAATRYRTHKDQETAGPRAMESHNETVMYFRSVGV